jgi:hypothetical protein
MHSSGDLTLVDGLCISGVLQGPVDVNLISVAQLCDQLDVIGYFTKEGGALMTKSGEIISEIERNGNTYMLHPKAQSSSELELYFTHSSKVSDDQLHQIFGHASARVLSKILNRTIQLTETCVGCCQGKLHDRSHKRSSRPEATGKLSDVWMDTVHSGLHDSWYTLSLFLTSTRDGPGSCFFEPNLRQRTWLCDF